MPFRSIFIACLIGSSLILSALIVNRARPARDTAASVPAFTQATGRCAQCHREETSAVVHQFESSQHSQANITCYDCHQALDGQDEYGHYDFVLARDVTSLNCQGCHRTEYEQFARSRHALPAWAAVRGTAQLSADQVAFGERFHPGAVNRPAIRLRRSRVRRRPRQVASGVTQSGCPTRMVRLAAARSATPAIRPPSHWHASLRHAGSATWVRIIRSSRSIASRSTACSSTRSGRR